MASPASLNSTNMIISALRAALPGSDHSDGFPKHHDKHIILTTLTTFEKIKQSGSPNLINQGFPSFGSLGGGESICNSNGRAKHGSSLKDKHTNRGNTPWSPHSSRSWQYPSGNAAFLLTL